MDQFRSIIYRVDYIPPKGQYGSPEHGVSAVSILLPGVAKDVD